MIAEFDFLKDLPAVVPELALTVLSVILLFMDVYLRESRRRVLPYVAGFGLLAIAVLPLVFTPREALLWGGMIRDDTLAQIFKVMVTIAGALTCFIAASSSDVARKGEFYLIIVVATLGACFLSSAADLIMVFVALETLSIPLYILAAFNRNSDRSMESGMKYFLFGAFASAIMLFGFSLLYGFTGETNVYAIGSALTDPAIFGQNAAPLLIAIGLVVVGFGFKISAVPFHFWTPDVYEGAPTPVTAFVSVASKAASFALLARFFVAAFPPTLSVDGQSIQAFWVGLISASAVLTMTLGNVVALAQRNIKRLLAYSSIAQAGYTLIGLAAVQSQTAQGVASIAFYMFMYTFTNMLAFGVIILFAERTGSEQIRDFAGLNRRSPMVALAMTIALLSLGGVPPAAGFFGKFFLFNAAVEAGLAWLALIGVINAIISLYYYLVVIKIMYVDHSEDEEQPLPVAPSLAWVLGVASVVVLLLGTFAAPLIFNWGLRGAETIMQFGSTITMLP